MATDITCKMKMKIDNFQNHENQFLAAIAGENQNTIDFITSSNKFNLILFYFTEFGFDISSDSFVANLMFMSHGTMIGWLVDTHSHVNS